MGVATMRIEGVDEILKKLDPAILQPIVVDGLNAFADIAKPEIEMRTPVFRGVLAKSVVVSLDDAHLVPEFVKVGPSKPHTHLVELGVKPHFPPWNDTSTKSGRRLRSWVRSHFAPAAASATFRKTDRKVMRALSVEERKDARESALDRATFLLARAISRRGVKWRFFIKDAFHAVEPQLGGVVDGMVEHLEAEWEKIGGPVGR